METYKPKKAPKWNPVVKFFAITFILLGVITAICAVIGFTHIAEFIRFKLHDEDNLRNFDGFFQYIREVADYHFYGFYHIGVHKITSEYTLSACMQLFFYALMWIVGLYFVFRPFMFIQSNKVHGKTQIWRRIVAWLIIAINIVVCGGMVSIFFEPCELPRTIFLSFGQWFSDASAGRIFRLNFISENPNVSALIYTYALTYVVSTIALFLTKLGEAKEGAPVAVKEARSYEYSPIVSFISVLFIIFAVGLAASCLVMCSDFSNIIKTYLKGTALNDKFAAEVVNFAKTMFYPDYKFNLSELHRGVTFTACIALAIYTCSAFFGLYMIFRPFLFKESLKTKKKLPIAKSIIYYVIALCTAVAVALMLFVIIPEAEVLQSWFYSFSNLFADGSALEALRLNFLSTNPYLSGYVYIFVSIYLISTLACVLTYLIGYKREKKSVSDKYTVVRAKPNKVVNGLTIIYVTVALIFAGIVGFLVSPLAHDIRISAREVTELQSMANAIRKFASTFFYPNYGFNFSELGRGITFTACAAFFTFLGQFFIGAYLALRPFWFNESMKRQGKTQVVRKIFVVFSSLLAIFASFLMTSVIFGKNELAMNMYSGLCSLFADNGALSVIRLRFISENPNVSAFIYYYLALYLVQTIILVITTAVGEKHEEKAVLKETVTLKKAKLNPIFSYLNVWFIIAAVCVVAVSLITFVPSFYEGTFNWLSSFKLFPSINKWLNQWTPVHFDGNYKIDLAALLPNDSQSLLSAKANVIYLITCFVSILLVYIPLEVRSIFESKGLKGYWRTLLTAVAFAISAVGGFLICAVYWNFAPANEFYRILTSFFVEGGALEGLRIIPNNAYASAIILFYIVIFVLILILTIISNVGGKRAPKEKKAKEEKVAPVKPITTQPFTPTILTSEPIEDTPVETKPIVSTVESTPVETKPAVSTIETTTPVEKPFIKATIRELALLNSLEPVIAQQIKVLPEIDDNLVEEVTDELIEGGEQVVEESESNVENESEQVFVLPGVDEWNAEPFNNQAAAQASVQEVEETAEENVQVETNVPAIDELCNTLSNVANAESIAPAIEQTEDNQQYTQEAENYFDNVEEQPTEVIDELVSQNQQSFENEDYIAPAIEQTGENQQQYSVDEVEDYNVEEQVDEVRDELVIEHTNKPVNDESIAPAIEQTEDNQQYYNNEEVEDFFNGDNIEESDQPVAEMFDEQSTQVETDDYIAPAIEQTAEMANEQAQANVVEENETVEVEEQIEEATETVEEAVEETTENNVEEVLESNVETVEEQADVVKEQTTDSNVEEAVEETTENNVEEVLESNVETVEEQTDVVEEQSTESNVEEAVEETTENNVEEVLESNVETVEEQADVVEEQTAESNVEEAVEENVEETSDTAEETAVIEEYKAVDLAQFVAVNSEAETVVDTFDNESSLTLPAIDEWGEEPWDVDDVELDSENLDENNEETEETVESNVETVEEQADVAEEQITENNVETVEEQVEDTDEQVSDEVVEEANEANVETVEEQVESTAEQVSDEVVEEANEAIVEEDTTETSVETTDISDSLKPEDVTIPLEVLTPSEEETIEEEQAEVTENVIQETTEANVEETSEEQNDVVEETTENNVETVEEQADVVEEQTTENNAEEVVESNVEETSEEQNDVVEETTENNVETVEEQVEGTAEQVSDEVVEEANEANVEAVEEQADVAEEQTTESNVETVEEVNESVEETSNEVANEQVEEVEENVTEEPATSTYQTAQNVFVDKSSLTLPAIDEWGEEPWDVDSSNSNQTNTATEEVEEQNNVVEEVNVETVDEIEQPLEENHEELVQDNTQQAENETITPTIVKPKTPIGIKPVAPMQHQEVETTPTEEHVLTKITAPLHSIEKSQHGKIELVEAKHVPFKTIRISADKCDHKITAEEAFLQGIRTTTSEIKPVFANEQDNLNWKQKMIDEDVKKYGYENVHKVSDLDGKSSQKSSKKSLNGKSIRELAKARKALNNKPVEETTTDNSVKTIKPISVIKPIKPISKPVNATENNENQTEVNKPATPIKVVNPILRNNINKPKAPIKPVDPFKKK